MNGLEEIGPRLAGAKTTPRTETDDCAQPVDGPTHPEPSSPTADDVRQAGADAVAGAAPEPEGETEAKLSTSSEPSAEVREQLARILDETRKYNARAAQREGVIDAMHAELERLRRGERRSLLRPLVTEMCRLRDDLVRQADTLPESFDATKAAELLHSYADSLEVALEDNGVTSYVPVVGDAFEARQHRAAGRTPTGDSQKVGRVAAVVSPGYRDVEAETVIAPARVVLYELGKPPLCPEVGDPGVSPETPPPSSPPRAEPDPASAIDPDAASDSARPNEDREHGE